MAFLAQGKITVSPAGPIFIRYPPYYRAVAASPAPAWIFVSTGRQACGGRRGGDGRHRPGLQLPGSGVPERARDRPVVRSPPHPYKIRDSGPYVVVLPSRRVLPSQILPAFGI